MMFIVVEKKAHGVICKHTYNNFTEVRSFCEEHFDDYIQHMSMASVVSLLENHFCEFSMVQERHEFVQFI